MEALGTDMDETIRGMKIIDNNGVYEYTVIDNVEKRAYKPFMQYGPVPLEQILKCNVLVQNKGW